MPVLDGSTIFIFLIALVLVITKLALERQKDDDRLHGLYDSDKHYTLGGFWKLMRTQRKEAKRLTKLARNGVIDDSTITAARPEGIKPTLRVRKFSKGDAESDAVAPNSEEAIQ